MTANEQAAHVSLSIPSEQSSSTDNFQFMNNSFTLPQDDQTDSTHVPLSQGYGN